MNKKPFLVSAFKKNLDRLLAQPDVALIRIVGEDADGEPVRDENDVRAKLNRGEAGRYLVVKEEDTSDVLAECLINEAGERESKKDKLRAQTAAPLETGGARVLSFANEVYGSAFIHLQSEIKRQSLRIIELETKNQSLVESLVDADAENPTENLMQLGLMAFQAWQSKDFKTKGSAFCVRVLERLNDSPEVKNFVGAIMQEELQKEATELLHEQNEPKKLEQANEPAKEKAS